MNEVRKTPFRLTAPKAFIPTEYSEQVAVFDYAKIAAKQDPRWSLLFATWNGVRLPIGYAQKLKRAGNRAGVPDLILPVVQLDDSQSSIRFPGLFIELKREKRGVVSEAQRLYQDALRGQGYLVCVAKGAREAIQIIAAYLTN